jgi:hypothetical protein
MNPQLHGPQHPHGEDDRLLTIDEVAELTRLPVATLRFKRHEGSGPRSFRMGRRVFYWLSDVLGGWCFSQRGGPPDVVINSGKLLWFKSLCSWGLVDDAGSGTQAGGSVAHHSHLLR